MCSYRRTITRHIQNIYKDEELSESSVCSFFEHTAEDGKKYKEDLKNKLQQGLDDIKLNKTYSLDEVFKYIDNL